MLKTNSHGAKEGHGVPQKHPKQQPADTHFPVNQSSLAVTLATPFSGPLCLSRHHFLFLRDVISGRLPGGFREGPWEGFRRGWRVAKQGTLGPVFPVPSAPRARRRYGGRRAALSGPVYSLGHQLCRHRHPVLCVPAEGPGRPRAQGQCWRRLALRQVISTAVMVSPRFAWAAA